MLIGREESLLFVPCIQGTDEITHQELCRSGDQSLTDVSQEILQIALTVSPAVTHRDTTTTTTTTA